MGQTPKYINMNPKHDVIIVGAGPGGSLLAYYLARSGLKTLVIEKQRLPRYKACGGGLTWRAVELLPFSVQEVIEDYTYSAAVSLNYQTIFEKTWDRPVLVMVMRDKFDHFLTEKALAAGAHLQTQATFRSVTGEAGDLRVETSAGSFAARVLVGADGVNSRAARSLGLTVRRDVMLGLEGEVYFREPRILSALKNTVFFDFEAAPQGYGWVFPKMDHLSIGVGSTSHKVKNLRRYFYNYLKMKNLEAGAEIRSLKPHLVPLGLDRRNVLANEKGLLVGDAAGLTDPVTGEGVYFALKEAQMAAEVIVSAFRNGRFELLTEYNELFHQNFSDEITCARRMNIALYKLPFLSRRVLRVHGQRLGESLGRLALNQNSYRAMYKKMFGLSWLFPLLLPGFGRHRTAKTAGPNPDLSGLGRLGRS